MHYTFSSAVKTSMLLPLYLHGKQFLYHYSFSLFFFIELQITVVVAVVVVVVVAVVVVVGPFYQLILSWKAQVHYNRFLFICIM